VHNKIVTDLRMDLTVSEIAKATQGGNPVIMIVRNVGSTRVNELTHYVVVDGVTTRMGRQVMAIRDPHGTQYFELVESFVARSTKQASSPSR